MYTHDLEHFLTKYNLPCPDRFTPLGDEEMKTRILHIHEELLELTRSAQSRDWPEVLDALVDITYLAVGTAVMCGANFDEAWNRVHDANMKKIRAEKKGDSKRGTTFDVVKPEGWKAADLSDLVGEHHG